MKRALPSESSISESRDKLCWSLPADGLLCKDEGTAAPACSSTQLEDEGEGDDEDEEGSREWTTAISECCCLSEEALEGPASGADAC